MRVIRLLFVLLIAAWAALTGYVIFWFRERYGRGGPMPHTQARVLLHPARRWLHPVRPMLEKFRIGPGQTVLELGPGIGYFTIEASRVVGPVGRIVCLDIQPEMIAMLRERLDEDGVANGDPLVGDATKLPLGDNSVDAAFLVTVLGEVPDRPRALAELRRVLKPGGVLSFSESLTDPDYVFQATLRDLCRLTGFQELDCVSEPLGYTMLFSAP